MRKGGGIQRVQSNFENIKLEERLSQKYKFNIVLMHA